MLYFDDKEKPKEETYIKDGVKVSGDNCPECNSNNLIREDGCIKCSNCAYSRC